MPDFDLGLQGGDPFYSGPQVAPVSPFAVEAPLAPPPISIDPERGAQLSDVPMNAAKDAGDIAKGIYQLATLPTARLAESLSGNGGLVRSTDLPEFAQFVGDAIRQTKEFYLDPILQGRPADLVQNAVEHPLFVGLDLWDAGAGRLAGGVAKSALKTELGSAARSSAAQVAKTLYGQLEATAPAMIDALQSIRTDRQVLQPLRQDLVNELKAERSNLKQLYDAVPAAEQKIMKGVLEGTVEAPFSALSPQAQNYVMARRALNDKMGDWLLRDGLVTAEQLELNRWIPTTLKRFGGAVGDYAPDQLSRMVEEVKRELGQRGIDPTYVPWMYEKQVKRILSSPAWEVSDSTARAAAKNLAGEADSTPGFARKRQSAGEGFHDNDLELALARHTEIGKYHLFFRKLMDRAIELGTNADEFTKLPIDKQLGLTPFNLRQFFRDAVKDIADGAALADKSTLATSLPEVIYLPKTVAKALSSASSRPSGWEKAFRYAAGFTRRYMLGTNPAFPEKQALQNEMMLFTAQWQGPTDIAKSLASHILAHSKDVRKAIPAELLGDEAAQIGSEVGMLPTRFGAAIDKIADMNFKRAGVYDNLFRTKAAIYYALRLSEKLGFKPLLTEMCSVSDAINRLQGVANNSQVVAELAKRVNTVCGDYSALSMRTGVRQQLRTAFLWYAWYEHIVRFAAQLPSSNPYKTAIMQHLAEAAPMWFNDEDAPEYLREAGALQIQGKTNPQGLREYVMASGMSPFSTLPELIAMVGAPFNDHVSDGAGIFTSVNPIFGVVLMALMGRKNPQTMRDFSNPDLIKFQGRQYKPEDIASGIPNPQEVHPVPNPIELVARQTFAWPTRAAERIYAKAAADAEPSQFTVPIAGQVAPKRVSSRGYEPMAADEWGDIALQLFLGYRALPIDDQAEMMRRIYEPKNQKDLQKAYIRQFGGR